jgi:ectoine hydroxylase-related dioxygenase (phytanoyl-CoA dioxygenase family)
MSIYKPASYGPNKHSAAWWHRDYLVRSPFITIPLVPWTVRNGATQFVPGTHLARSDGKIDPMIIQSAPEDVEACEMFGVTLPEARDPDPQRIRNACMNVGDMLFTHSMVFHRRPLVACKRTSGRDCIYITFE